jgi:EAL domain-containing protein (putative c-di-GMP-specific phosphodiesterase class I)
MVQLVRMPFSEVKIDRSFVMTALKNAESHAVVSCIAALAQRLGLGMVAEGVEDLAMVGVLDGMGCQSLQGFAISRPLEAGEVGSWARDWSRRRRTEPWP